LSNICIKEFGFGPEINDADMINPVKLKSMTLANSISKRKHTPGQIDKIIAREHDAGTK
jgi:hypothetical protein